jgi:hypothetical protein
MSCQHSTQNERLLAEFKKGRRLTMSQIHQRLHINNPWARISELRSQRHRIKDDYIKTGGGARIKVYWLAGRRAA